jgi:hypothetical protein
LEEAVDAIEVLCKERWRLLRRLRLRMALWSRLPPALMAAVAATSDTTVIVIVIVIVIVPTAIAATAAAVIAVIAVTAVIAVIVIVIDGDEHAVDGDDAAVAVEQHVPEVALIVPHGAGRYPVRVVDQHVEREHRADAPEVVRPEEHCRPGP